MVAPLVVIGTKESDGQYDLCAETHGRAPVVGQFFWFRLHTESWHVSEHPARGGIHGTVSRRPTRSSSRACRSSPRCDEGTKPSLLALPTFQAQVVDGVFLRDATLFFECRLHSIVDGFGDNSLIAGRIVAAHAMPNALRSADLDDQDVIHDSPLLAYLAPGRCADRGKFVVSLPSGVHEEAGMMEGARHAAHKLRDHLAGRRDEMVTLLAALARAESPSREPAVQEQPLKLLQAAR